MKANELMVGDWVLYNGKPIQVDEIFGDGINADYCGGEIMGLINEDELSPIPLTPEILEKNGFETQEQGGGRIDVWTGCGPDAEGDIEIEFDNGVPIHSKIDASYKGEYYTSNNIHFVHKLQHALRLCGIEKEIEL